MRPIPTTSVAPIPFSQIADMHRTAQETVPGFNQLDLREFAKLGNYATGSDQFAAADINDFAMGLSDLSSLINYGLEKSGATEVGRNFGGFLGGLMGSEELGREVGASLPRGVVNMVPLVAGGPLGLIGMGGLTGIDVFEQTGSPARAAFAGAAGAAMPFAIGKVGGALVNNPVGKALTSSNVTGIPTRFGANVVASFGADVAADVGDIALAPEREINEVLTSDYWKTRVIANTAFMPLDAGLAIKDQVTPKVAREINHVDADAYTPDTIVDPVIASRSRGSGLDLGPDGGSVAPKEFGETFGPEVDPREVPKLFGEPFGPEPFAFPEVLPEGRAANPFDLSPKVSDPAKAFFERVMDKKPQTLEEFQTQTKAVNELREDVGQVPLNDVTLRTELEVRVDEGLDVDDASGKVVQTHKNLVAEVARRSGDVDKLGDAGRELFEGLDALTAREPSMGKGVEVVKARLLRNADDEVFFREAVKEVEAWSKEFVAYDSPEAIKRLRSRLGNAKKRTTTAKRKEEAGPVKKGRKSNAVKKGLEKGAKTELEAEVLTYNEVFERVEALPEEARVEVIREFEKFIKQASSIQHLTDPTTVGVRVLGDYLQGGSELNLPNMFGSALLNLKKESARAMAARGWEGGDHDFAGKDGRDVLMEDLDDLEFNQYVVEDSFVEGDLFRLDAAKDLTLVYNVPEFSVKPNGIVKFGKLQSDKKGMISLRALEKTSGWNGKQLKKQELDLWKLVVPEAFVGDKVDVVKLTEGLSRAEPVLEVKTLGDHVTDTAEMRRLQTEHNQLVHKFETLGFTVEVDAVSGNDTVVYSANNKIFVPDEVKSNRYTTQIPRQYAESLRRLYELSPQVAQASRGFVGPNERPEASRYAFVAPKAETDMPGYVEGLVRIPRDDYESNNSKYVRGKMTLEELNQKPRTPIYIGPHFGSDDTNVVAFFRGYEEVMPDGGKAFHVIEVQADLIKKLEDGRGFRVGNDNTIYKTRAEANVAAKELHPLFDPTIFQPLALKAAIQHAKKIGADKIILSDAETTMMTEGHDTQGTYMPGEYTVKDPHGPGQGRLVVSRDGRRATFYDSRNLEKSVNPRVNPQYYETVPKGAPQEGGMRLNYDKIMPKELTRLTGDKGEVVDLGRHVKIEKLNNYQQGSPVFKNPDGTPKSNITGRAYSLENVNDAATTLFGAKGERAMTDRQHAQSLLERQGHTPSVAKVLSPAVLKVAKMVEQATGREVAFGRLTNIGETGAAGMASRSGVLDLVHLDPTLPKDQANFVALHEVIGHHFDEAYKTKSLDSKTSKAYEDARTHVERLSLEDRQTLLNSMSREFLPQKLHAELEGVFKETAVSFDETMANLNAIIASGIGNNSAAFKWLPESVGRYARQVMKFAADVWDGARTFVKYQKLKRQIGNEAVKDISKFSKELRRQYSKLDAEYNKSAKEFAELDKAMAGGLTRFREAADFNVGNLQLDGNKAVQIAGDAMLIPKELRNTVSKFLEPGLSRLNRYPALRRVQYAAMSETPMSHSLSRGILSIGFGDKNSKGGYVKALKDGGPISKVVKDPDAGPKLNDLLLRLQEEDLSLFTLKTTDPARFDAEMAQFDPAIRPEVENTVSRLEAMTKETNSWWHRTELKVAEIDLATLLRDKSTLPNEALHNLSKEVLTAYREARASRDYTNFDALLASQGLDKQFIQTFLEPVVNNIALKEQFRDKRPHWITERRMGRYQVRFDAGKGKGSGMTSFDDLGQALKFVKDSKKNGYKLFYPGNGVKDTAGTFSRKGNKFDEYKDIMESANQRTMQPVLEEMHNNGLISDDTLGELQSSLERQSAAMSAEVTNVDLGNVSVNRRFADGREHLDMVDQHLRWINKSSVAMPRMETDAWMRLERRNPEITESADNVRLFEDAMDMVRVMRTPDSRAGQLVTQGTFLHFLGLNPSNMLIELTQFPINLSPMLTNEGASISQSYTLPGKAMESLMESNVTGKFNSGKKVGGYDLHDVVVQRGHKEGLVGLGQFQEVAEAGMDVRMDFNALATGGQPKGKGWIKSALGAYMHLASRLYGLAAGFNEKVALISATELVVQRDLGGSKQLSADQLNAAWPEIVRIAKSATGGFGRSNRPVGFFDNHGAWRGASQAMYSLGSYNSSQLSNLWSYVRKGLGKDLEGFSPKERAQARKAATQAFATMISLVGVIGGIPMVGPLMRLLEDNSELEIEKNFREFLVEVGGEEHGRTFADFAMHGAMYGAGVPFDISSRIQPGGVLGLNSYEGWSPSALLGPAFSQGETYVKATKSALQGDLTKATEQALPAGMRRAYSLWANDGDYVNNNGEVVLKPTEAEKVALSLGLNPSRATKLRDRERIERTAARIRSERNKKVYSEAKDVYKKQGPGAAQRYLLTHADSEAGFDVRAATRNLAKQIYQDSVGKDPRRIGGKAGAVEARAASQTFDFSDFPSVTEPERFMGEAMIQLQMGVPPRDMIRGMKSAILTEELQRRSGLPYAASRFVAGQLSNPSLEGMRSAQEFLPFL